MPDDKQPDQRPRPRFGELAPEGWVWNPPPDQNRLDTSRTPESDAHSTPAAPSDVRGYPPPQGQPLPPWQLRRDAPRWNAGWSIALLIVGFLGMSYSMFVLNVLPSIMAIMHVQQKLPAYRAAPSVAGIVAAGSIVMGAIWLISAALTVWLLARQRVSFYVPLVAGVVALIVLGVFISVIVSTDPALVTLYGSLSPAPNTTP